MSIATLWVFVLGWLLVSCVRVAIDNDCLDDEVSGMTTVILFSLGLTALMIFQMGGIDK